MAEKYEFVKKVLFAGLKNRNTGFDSPLIPHVSAEDFQIVIARCATTNTELIGIEIFEEGKYLVDVVISPEPGLNWARGVTREYAGRTNITLCATFRMEGEPLYCSLDASLEAALSGAPTHQDK